MKKILLLEDDKEILELLAYKCEEFGFEVFSCTEASEFQEYTQQDHFDLILSDFYINSTDLLQILQSTQKELNTPVIMMNGMLPDKKSLKLLENYQVIDILDKPFNLNDLKATFLKHNLL